MGVQNSLEFSRLSLPPPAPLPDRKSTRLNSSHVRISYAVFCLKKKTDDRAGVGPPPRGQPARQAEHQEEGDLRDGAGVDAGRVADGDPPLARALQVDALVAGGG